MNIIKFIIIVSIALLTADLIYDQVVNALSESERSLATCSTNYLDILNFTNRFSPETINMTNPGAKNVITNLCNYFHDEYGVWINPFIDRAEQYPMDVDKFLGKYYSNGIPGPDLRFLRELTQITK